MVDRDQDSTNMTDNSNSVSNMNKKDDDSVSVAGYSYDDVPQDIHELNDIIQRSVTNNPNDNVLTRSVSYTHLTLPTTPYV